MNGMAAVPFSNEWNGRGGWTPIGVKVRTADFPWNGLFSLRAILGKIFTRGDRAL